MEWFWYNGKFLGIEWHFWKVIGWLGNAAFSARILVQWYATERRKQVVIPAVFWWLSLVGSLFLLSYALVYQKDSVFIFSYAFNWIPFIRNLMIHYRHQACLGVCVCCDFRTPPDARFCPHCGTAVPIKDGNATDAA